MRKCARQMWERLPTEDLTGALVYIKVMRHEKVPDPRCAHRLDPGGRARGLCACETMWKQTG